MMQIEGIHQLFLKSSGICTDSRKITKNTIFLALKGENFNGNDYAMKALEEGAAVAIIDEGESEDKRVIKVRDSLQTLQALATFHRKYLGIPILALTGSNGKTTTKELIAQVLSRKFIVTATRGNLNNHIGVPLTLLSMTKETELGIVEMGANHQREIDMLCKIAQPDYGYITNFGKAHLEGFGGPEGVIAGKKELYLHLKKRKKFLFLNLDDPLQAVERSYPLHYSFGESEAADVRIDYFLEDSHAGINFRNLRIRSRLIGRYNGANIAAAACIGHYFEVADDHIGAAISQYDPKDNRSQVIRKGSNTLILDAYNANPTSMEAALDNFASMAVGPKVAFLGDMFELGISARAEHQALVDRLEELNFGQVYLIGENFFKTKAPAGIHKFATFEDFKAHFDPTAVRHAQILIKGSRGMAMERIVDLLM